MPILRSLIFLITITFLGGCTSNNYIQQTNKFIQSQNLIKEVVNTNHFDIVTFTEKPLDNSTLKVFIEGDGKAWLNRYTPSTNPTPANPTGLKLMLKDEYPNKLYIARPCQYQDNDSRNCTKQYWTNKRFSQEIVDNTNELINHYKKHYGFKDITLVGYSGGATVALLLSSKRDDIKHITTIAGNLNPDYWTKYHNITPLDGLNPISYVDKLENISQIHLIGGKDKIIPIDIFNSYIKYFNNTSKISYKVIKNNTHSSW